MALPKKGAAPASTVQFGSLDNYSQGGGVPEDDYCLSDFSFKVHAHTKQDGTSAGPARLGVMITLVSLSGDGEPREQFYSLGSKADQSFAPDSETGKKLVAVPGGPGGSLNNSTNWAVFLKSLYDSGLPQGILSDDLSVLDGVHVHIANIPEPEGRKSFQAQTGEAAGERKNNTIAVVTEIKDDGKPWEGTGGVPEAKPAAKANGKPAGAVVAKPVTSKVPVKAALVEVSDEQDMMAVAQSAVASVIAKQNGKPLLKLILRTSTFKVLNESHPDMTQEVMDTFFTSDENTNALLGELGYKLEKGNVVAA